MLVMPELPKIPKGEKMVTFLEALNDETGETCSRYIKQQAIKNPSFPNLWCMSMIPSMDLPINFATLKFEKDKAHYLETGELPHEY